MTLDDKLRAIEHLQRPLPQESGSFFQRIAQTMQSREEQMPRQPKLQSEWAEDCLRYYGKEDVLQGGHKHWCADWDFLPIDDTCEEFKSCNCFKGA